MKRLVLLVMMMFSFMVQPIIAEEIDVTEYQWNKFIKENNLEDQMYYDGIRNFLIPIELHYSNREYVSIKIHDDNSITVYFKKYGDKITFATNADAIPLKKAFYDYLNDTIETTWQMDRTLYHSIDERGDELILGFRLLSTTMYITYNRVDGKWVEDENSYRVAYFDRDITDEWNNGDPKVLANQFAFNKMMYMVLTEL